MFSVMQLFKHRFIDPSDSAVPSKQSTDNGNESDILNYIVAFLVLVFISIVQRD